MSNKPKQIMQIYGTEKEPNPQAGRVYSEEGIAPCLDSCGGGNRMPKIIRPVLAPDRLEKKQNGRRIKEDGEPMFTLTSQDRHGVLIKPIEVRGKEISESKDIAHCLNANDQRKFHGTKQAHTMVAEIEPPNVGGGISKYGTQRKRIPGGLP